MQNFKYTKHGMLAIMSKTDPAAHFIGKVKLSKQGQITLPTEARTELSIATDEELYWYRFNDSLILSKEIVNPKDLKAYLERKVKP